MDYAALMIIGIMVAMLVAYTVIEHWWFLKKRKEEENESEN